MILRFYFILITISCITVTLFSQDIQLKANYPPVVAAGEQFAISWNINEGGGRFTEPSFTGFGKLFGPQTSFSSSTQIINGKFSKQESHTYTFFLQAVTAGKYVIPPAVVTIKNKEYKSDSLYIEVVEGQVQEPVNQDNRSETQADPAGQPSGSDLYVRLILSRNEVYQGEHITATVKLFSRIDNLGGLSEIKLPDFKGFVNEALETPRLESLQRENVGGQVYGTGTIQQFLLYPQTTGDITIDPVEVTALIQQRIGNSDPFFGDFFAQVRNVPRMIASKPVTVRVKPLPANRPSDFSGIVGKISLKATLNKDTVNVNDALNFRITVTGTGNLKLAGNPSLKLSPDLEVYEPKITDNVRSSAAGTSGEKGFEYIIIPRHHGEYRIPPVSYSFFNPASGRYETLSTEEFSFFVRKGAEQQGGATVFGGVAREDVRYIGKDIRFIKSLYGKAANPSGILISRKYFYTIYGFAFLLFLAILIIRREHIRRNADITSVRNRKAARVAGKRLAEASKCLKTGLLDKFHEEILKALWGYLSDKLSIPVSGLTRTTAEEALRARDIDENLISQLSDILDKCEFARFAPAASDAEATEIYSGAMNFIKSVENNR